MNKILLEMTRDIFLDEKERKNLKKIAKKIEKVPDTIHVPIEYWIGEKI